MLNPHNSFSCFEHVSVMYMFVCVFMYMYMHVEVRGQHLPSVIVLETGPPTEPGPVNWLDGLSSELQEPPVFAFPAF